jgi:predicted nucleic acid-binding protein
MMPLLDTWVWLEYFGGSPSAARLRAIVEGPEVATSVITLAELADVYERDGRSKVVDERIQFIRSRGAVLPVPEDAARRAGKTKWAQRKKGHPLGLADAMIYETARETGLTFVSGDVGFKGLVGVQLVNAQSR